MHLGRDVVVQVFGYEVKEQMVCLTCAKAMDGSKWIGEHGTHLMIIAPTVVLREPLLSSGDEDSQGAQPAADQLPQARP